MTAEELSELEAAVQPGAVSGASYTPQQLALPGPLSQRPGRPPSRRPPVRIQPHRPASTAR